MYCQKWREICFWKIQSICLKIWNKADIKLCFPTVQWSYKCHWDLYRDACEKIMAQTEFCFVPLHHFLSMVIVSEEGPQLLQSCIFGDAEVYSDNMSHLVFDM